jgi:hypothetical protein
MYRDSMKGNIMTARTRNRKPAVVDVVVPDDNTPAPSVIDSTPSNANVGRKYMSHEHCGHARKGEAGKNARANCRRAYHAWFTAESEFFATDAGIAYLATNDDPRVIKAA